MNTTGLVEMLKEICSEDSILVTQAYRFFKDEMTLPEFKALLVKAWRERKISLSRCDTPELFIEKQVADSEIRYGIARLDMVQAKAW